MNEYLFTESHEWIKYVNESTVQIGLTDYAQLQLGDLVFVNLPEVGELLTAGKEFADVESVKAVSSIYSPVSGRVSAINEELIDQPQLINMDAFGAWFIEVSEISRQVPLLSEEDYKKLCL